VSRSTESPQETFGDMNGLLTEVGWVK